MPTVFTPTWSDLVAVTGFAAPTLLVRGATVRGTLDLRAKHGGRVFVKVGRNGTTALTAGIDVLIRAVLNNDVAAAGGAHPAGITMLGQLTAAQATTINADSASGQAALNVASSASWAANDYACVQDAKAAPGFAFRSDAGVFTDLTTAAGDATANDVVYFRAAPAVNDAFYIGSATKFMGVEHNIGTAAVGPTLTTVWEYWNGSAWTTLTSAGDDTVSLLVTTTGTKYHGFAPPASWTTTTVNSQSAYWIRNRISAFTSFTTKTLGTQLWTYGYARLEWHRASKIAAGIITVDRPLQFTHTAAQADTVRNKADVFGPRWLEGGSLYEVLCDYGDDTTGEPVTVQALAQTLDSMAGTP